MRLKVLSEPDEFRNRYASRGISIPSRYFLAPINTGFAPGGQPNRRFIDFYKLRSGRSLGITYIGNVSVGKEWVANLNTPWLSSDSFYVWEELASIISRNGSIPGIQLACRASNEKPLKEWRRKDAKSFLKQARCHFKEISKEEINRILESFVSSGRLAIKSGFKVIQIHAAHGYFLAQLLDSRLNDRDDRFGTNPVSVIQSIVSALRSIDRNILIDLRLSLVEGFEDRDLEYTRKVQMIGELVKTGLDMISLSSGTYDFNKHLIYPLKTWGHGPYLNMAIPLSQRYPNLIWNVTGNIWDIRKLPPSIPANLTFSIGRALIADPDLVKKSFSGTYKTIRWCTRRGDCHYYSKGKKHIYCPLEPSLNSGSEASSECLK